MNIAQSDVSEQTVRPEWERVYSERLGYILDEISEVLDLHFNGNPFRSLRCRFVLGHAPRVGSHLLCEHLRGYGLLVREYFELSHMSLMAEKRGFVSVEEFCNWLLDKFALQGLFGVSGGVKVLAPMVLAGEIPDCIADWRFVHLTRDDFVARAVSEFIARHTKAFTSARTPANPRPDKPRPLLAILPVRRSSPFSDKMPRLCWLHPNEPARLVATPHPVQTVKANWLAATLVHLNRGNRSANAQQAFSKIKNINTDY